MNLLDTAPSWLALLLTLLLLLAAAEDGWRTRISNYTSLAVGALALVAAVVAGLDIGLWQNLALSMAVMTFGTLLFARGWMGGGDVKLLAACGLWLDLSTGWKMLVAVAIAGGVEALLVVGLRFLPWPQAVGSSIALFRPKAGIPYGIAIAAGMALVLAWVRG